MIFCEGKYSIKGGGYPEFTRYAIGTLLIAIHKLIKYIIKKHNGIVLR